MAVSGHRFFALESFALEFEIPRRFIVLAAMFHKKGIEPAAMAIPRDALTAAHQTEPAFQVQTFGRCIVLQDRGLQRPVTGRFGLLAEGGEQIISQPPAPEPFADVDADLGHAPVAPAGVDPVQGRPARQDAIVLHHKAAFFDVGGQAVWKVACSVAMPSR